MQERRLSAEKPKNSSTLFSSWERKHNRTPSASPAFRQAGMTLTIQFPSTSEKFDNRITCYCLLIACFPTEVTPRNMLSLWPNVLGVPNLSWPPQLNRSQHTTAKDGCFCWCCAGSHIFWTHYQFPHEWQSDDFHCPLSHDNILLHLLANHKHEILHNGLMRNNVKLLRGDCQIGEFLLLNQNGMHVFSL